MLPEPGHKNFSMILRSPCRHEGAHLLTPIVDFASPCVFADDFMPVNIDASFHTCRGHATARRSVILRIPDDECHALRGFPTYRKILADTFLSMMTATLFGRIYNELADIFPTDFMRPACRIHHWARRHDDAATRCGENIEALEHTCGYRVSPLQAAFTMRLAGQAYHFGALPSITIPPNYFKNYSQPLA